MFQVKKRWAAALMALVLVATSLFLVMTSAASSQVEVQNTYDGSAPKYVFLFIGDGMSSPQINAAEIFEGKRYYEDKKVGTRRLSFTKFPAVGMCTTFDAESFCPDSASTGTSISTGNKTLGGVINMDVEKKVKFATISELAKAKGYKIGVVSSVSLDHATPAAFYAHQPSRSNYYDIAMEMANSNFDYFAGGGFLQPKGKNGDKADVIETAVKNGFRYVNTKSEILALNASAGKVIVVNPILDSSKALSYEIDRAQDDLSLADFTRKGIDVLYNSKGFFMMVEGGKIDWACHANDAGSSIHDTLALSKAVEEAVEFYNEHPKDTLIIVTGDHETGGLTIGWAGTGYETFFEKIGLQTQSYLEFDKTIADYRGKTAKENAKLEDLLPQIKKTFGLMISTDTGAAANPGMVLSSYEVETLRNALAQSMIPAKERKLSDGEKIMYGSYEPLSVTLTHILNNKSGIGWTSYSHTGLPLPVFAKGSGASLFEGYYDNTDIFKKLVSIMKLNK